ncbi:hypothetical protein PMAYCL1PPCAC_05415, partial [Pristionchus mayeri]
QSRASRYRNLDDRSKMADAGAAPAAVAAEPGLMGMNIEEEKFLKEVGMKVAVSSITHPLLTTKTLIQLGHEPFALSTGKTLIVTGRNAYFLPNAFSYAKQLAETHPAGWSVLMTGFDSAALALIAGRYTTRWATDYLDKHFPDMGGKPENIDEDERKLTDSQSFRRALRGAIRDSSVRTVAVFAARPFTVVCIRQIAQLIGGEGKYLNAAQGLSVILGEEGLGGLFSGVIPQLCAELIMVWGCAFVSFGAERALTRSGIDQNEDKEKGEKDYKEAQRLINLFTPHVVSPFSYPYSVVSTVMACVGSGLIVSFLPYNPTFNNWQDAFEYLRPHGLKRGARLFLREQTGAVSVGMDKQLYASNKHFA